MGSSVLNQQPDGAYTRAGRPTLEVQILTSPEELYSLQPEWNSLLADSAHPNIFLTWEWIATWWGTFGVGLRPWILVAREGPRRGLVGLAPFVLQKHPFRSGPYRQLSFLGTTVASGDHLDVVSRQGYEELVAARFAEALQPHPSPWDTLALDYMDTESPLVAQLLRQNQRPVMLWETICPFLSLPERWEDYRARLGKNKRYNLRRHADKLQRDTAGGVEHQQVRSSGELAAALEDLFRLHQAVRNKQGDPGVFRAPRVREFHRRVAEQFLAQDWLRLYLLKIQGRTAAVFYCFRYQDRVSFYQTGYDLDWARYSPGEAIMAHAIRSSIEEGARELDLLRGAEPYKSEWTATARRNLRLRLATTRRGSCLVQAYRLMYATRSTLRRWRGRQADGNLFSETRDSSSTSTH